MAQLLISELIETLDLIGTVYRNRDNSKPADAIQKVKEQVSGFETLTVSEWVAKRQPIFRPSGNSKKTKVPAGEEIIKRYSERLKDCQNETEIQSALQDLGAAKLLPAQWIKVALDVTGQAERSGVAAQRTLRTFLQARVLRQSSRENIAKVFE